MKAKYNIKDEVAFRWKLNDNWVLLEGIISTINEYSYGILVGFGTSDACLYENVPEEDIIYVAPSVFND